VFFAVYQISKTIIFQQLMPCHLIPVGKTVFISLKVVKNKSKAKKIEISFGIFCFFAIFATAYISIFKDNNFLLPHSLITLILTAL